jgi:HisJ family histidinol phosphate phosphatase
VALNAETVPDVHGHAKGEHRAFARERPIPYTARMLFLWFHRAARGAFPRSLTVTDHTNCLAPGDPEAVATFRRALEYAREGDVERAAQLAGVSVSQAATLGEGLRRGMRCTIGIEADNDPRSAENADDIVEAMQPETVIRSVHFVEIEHPVSGDAWAWPFDNPEFIRVFERVGAERLWALYTSALFSDLRVLRADIVGHFYVPSKFGHWPKREILEAYEEQLLDICAEKQIAVEFNTRLLYREASRALRSDYVAAHRRLLQKAEKKGVRVVLGSDAHRPADQGVAFDVAVELMLEHR